MANKTESERQKELREALAKHIFYEKHPVTDSLGDMWGITGTMDDASWRRFEQHCFYSADKLIRALKEYGMAFLSNATDADRLTWVEELSLEEGK